MEKLASFGKKNHAYLYDLGVEAARTMLPVVCKENLNTWQPAAVMTPTKYVYQNANEVAQNIKQTTVGF